MEALGNKSKAAISLALQQAIKTRKGVGGYEGSVPMLSRASGVAETSIKQIRANDWGSVSVRAAHKLGRHLGVNVEGVEAGWADFETPQKLLAAQVLTKARQRHRRAVINGGTGIGKSHAVKSYFDMAGPEVCRVVCRKSMNTITFMKEIARQAGVYRLTGSLYDLESRVADRFAEMECPQLIIDEIENLKHVCWPSIKSIIDAVANGRHLSVVLVGINVTGILQENSHKNGFVQLNRRFPRAAHAELPPMDKETVKSILAQTDIKSVHVADWFYENIKDYDGFETTVIDAKRLAGREGQQIDRHFMDAYFGW